LPTHRAAERLYKASEKGNLMMRWKLVVPSLVAVTLLGTGVAYSDGFTLSAPPKIAFLYFA
jgi:hypothetical protein